MISRGPESRYNVALVIGQLTHGGAERQIIELALGMQKNDTPYLPVVFCYSDRLNPYGPELTSAGVSLHHPPERLHRGWQTVRWLHRWFRKENCTLVYSFLNPTNVNCVAATLFGSPPLIASVRGVPELRGSLRAGLRLAYKRARCIVANSEACARWAVDVYGAERKKVYVVPNSVTPPILDHARGQELRRKLGIPPEATVIGTVAKMKAQKAPDLFLEVARSLLDFQPKPNIHFVWVGDGPLQQEVNEKWQALPLNLRKNVHFPGASNEIPGWLSAFDVFILTSAWEGMPNALMEAMAAGKPCLATDVDGTRDLMVDGRNGILAPFDPLGFSEALKSFLQDESRWACIAKTARRDMQENYSRRLLVERTARIFDQVLTR